MDPDAKAVLDWIKRHDLLGPDVHLYTPEAWARRGEPYGRNAIFTITAEGPLNHLINAPETREDRRLIASLNRLLERRGLWYEQGYSWSFHFYRDERPEIDSTERARKQAVRARIAEQANELVRHSRRGGWPELTADSEPEELIEWMTTNDPNSSWAEAYDDEEVDEDDLWAGIADYIRDA